MSDFFIETLADLGKKFNSDRFPEHEVSVIANKTPERHSQPNVFHTDICIANLHGYNVSMNGRPMISGGRPVKVSGKSGIVFDVSPEAKAFIRWQEEKFMELERDFARQWRYGVTKINFQQVIDKIISLGIDPSKYNSLSEAKNTARSLINIIKPD